MSRSNDCILKLKIKINIKRLRLLFLLLVFAISSSLINCSTTAGTTTSTTAGKIKERNTIGQDKGNQGKGKSNAEIEYRLKQYLENGLERINNGEISDGLRQLVAIFAEGEKLDKPDEEIKSIINEAKTELEKIGDSLSIEPGNEWLDNNMNQIKAKTTDLNGKGAIQPSIILTYNSGMGKNVVSSAPIQFKFVKGGGILTQSVNTNTYGQANCSIVRFDNVNEENIIRATLVVKEGDYTYTFDNVTRDFVYIPPPKKAVILVMEKSKLGVSNNPAILDTVYNELKGIAFDFSQYNGALNPGQFSSVFNGEPDAIKNLGIKKEVSYIVTVLNNCYLVSQVVYNGKKYDIFKTKTNATVRIVRISDGKIVYSVTVQGVNGQGSTEEKAVINGYRNAAAKIGEKLKYELDNIKSSLLGDG